MTGTDEFIKRLDSYVVQQFRSQRIGYLLGAGSSFLNSSGYPLAMQLWDQIKDKISDANACAEIQEKLDAGAQGIEHALDLLDGGHPVDGPHRHLVTAAIATVFENIAPPLDIHIEFVKRLSQRSDPSVKVFSLNYDPLMERAAERARIRLCDGFSGNEHAYFEAAIFEERIGRIRGNFRTKQFEETVKPIHLLKLHGSLGWYECQTNGLRRCAFSSPPPAGVKRLMIPPQRRKANDTMTQPYAALWSSFRAYLGQGALPLNRLVCIGYGFADEHVNAVIDGALAGTNFTLLAFAKALNDAAWNRWSVKRNTVVVTEARCSLKGETGAGHPDLWSFEKLAMEV